MAHNKSKRRQRKDEASSSAVKSETKPSPPASPSSLHADLEFESTDLTNAHGDGPRAFGLRPTMDIVEELDAQDKFYGEE